MKLPSITAIPLQRNARASGRSRLKPRSTYPTLSIVPLYRGPLRKLAWIFGFGR